MLILYFSFLSLSLFTRSMLCACHVSHAENVDVAKKVGPTLTSVRVVLTLLCRHTGNGLINYAPLFFIFISLFCPFSLVTLFVCAW